VTIVYLTPSGQLGGAERSLLDLLAALRTIRPQWRLRLISAEDGPLIARANALGVNASVVAFPRRLGRLGDFGTSRGGHNRSAAVRPAISAMIAVVPYTVRLLRAVNQAAPDLLHTNGFKMHILGIWARRRGVPVLWHVRDHVASRVVMARLLRSHSRWCAAAVTNSYRVADDVRSVCGERLNIYPVHDGIDLADFSPTGPALDLDALAEMPATSPPPVRVGLLATMARWKGHAIFLRALSLIPASLRIRGYVISGALYQTEGSQLRVGELRALAAQLGIASKVGFTDFVEDPAAAMRGLDIVVHASTEPEPFGRVIGEAVACGRAVVASDSAGAVELLDPGVDALTHPCGDTAALAERIATLAANPDLRARLAERGRLAAERHFDRIRPARQIVPIYKALVPAAD